MSQFTCGNGGTPGPLRVLALGRYSTAKGLTTVVRAVAAVAGARLEVHGPAMTDAEHAHRRELEALVAELGAGGRVALGDPVPRERVPELLAYADAVVNNMRAGAADKIVLEAAASCVPVLASDPGWAETLDGLDLPLRFARDDPASLAARLEALAAAGPETRARVGRELRRRVEQRHSVESWARGVVAAST
jgi:glycosyltransferase involved in cell wall biosynthesis